MRIRLTRRLAEQLNGVDLSRHAVGDTMDLSSCSGDMLIKEGWAMRVYSPRNGDRRRIRADDAKVAVRWKNKGRS
jgi:hypothetical protein